MKGQRQWAAILALAFGLLLTCRGAMAEWDLSITQVNVEAAAEGVVCVDSDLAVSGWAEFTPPDVPDGYVEEHQAGDDQYYVLWDYNWSWDGGSATSTDDATDGEEHWQFDVSWSTAGLKTVTLQVTGHLYRVVGEPDPDPGNSENNDVEEDTAQASDTCNVTSILVEITQPTGDPTDPAQATQFNEISFDANTPGVLSLVCTAADSGGDNNYLTWHCDLNGEEWDPQAGPTYEGGKSKQSEFTYTGLPTEVMFGTRTIKLVYYKDGAIGYGPASIDSDSNAIEVFYHPTAQNHPGPNQGETDNFFYYYQDTPARCSDAEFDDNLGDAGQVYYEYSLFKNIVNVSDHIDIGTAAAFVSSVGPYTTAGNGYEDVESYIDGYRVTCAHEKEHWDNLTDGEGHNDEDDDGLADFIEDANGDGNFDPLLGETNWDD
jgi:hypothetical protein